jgi:hypothetical protein
MFIKRCFLVQISALIPTLLLGIQPLGAQTSSVSHLGRADDFAYLMTTFSY